MNVINVNDLGDLRESIGIQKKISFPKHNLTTSLYIENLNIDTCYISKTKFEQMLEQNFKHLKRIHFLTDQLHVNL